MEASSATGGIWCSLAVDAVSFKRSKGSGWADSEPTERASGSCHNSNINRCTLVRSAVRSDFGIKTWNDHE